MGRHVNMCVLVLAMLLGRSLPVAGEGFSFYPPFKIKHIYGETLSISSISIDEDTSGTKLYIYTTTDGKEGFVTKDNIKNFEDLLDAMYPSRVVEKRRKQQASAEAARKSTSYSSSLPPKTTYELSSATIDPDAAADLINSMYGKVCRAKIKGIFSKTLVIDWTSSTKLIHAMKVIAEIGNIKEQLYYGGVRYFKFPNDSGTYNIIDWKTGKKKSTSDRAPYYFD